MVGGGFQNVFKINGKYIWKGTYLEQVPCLPSVRSGKHYAISADNPAVLLIHKENVVQVRAKNTLFNEAPRQKGNYVQRMSNPTCTPIFGKEDRGFLTNRKTIMFI